MEREHLFTHMPKFACHICLQQSNNQILHFVNPRLNSKLCHLITNFMVMISSFQSARVSKKKGFSGKKTCYSFWYDDTISILESVSCLFHCYLLLFSCVFGLAGRPPLNCPFTVDIASYKYSEARKVYGLQIAKCELAYMMPLVVWYLKSHIKIWSISLTKIRSKNNQDWLCSSCHLCYKAQRVKRTQKSQKSVYI